MKNWELLDQTIDFDEALFLEEMAEMHVDLARLNRVGPVGAQPYLYALVRRMQPEVVVETGVYNGVSTALIALALQKNGHGVLISCDPAPQVSASKIARATGITPPHQHWKLHKARGIAVLPGLDEGWDLFIHDSDHNHVNMRAELDIAWRKLRPGGFLVCDDWQHIRARKTLPHFCDEKGVAFAEIGTAAILFRPDDDADGSGADALEQALLAAIDIGHDIDAEDLIEAKATPLAATGPLPGVEPYVDPEGFSRDADPADVGQLAEVDAPVAELNEGETPIERPVDREKPAWADKLPDSSPESPETKAFLAEVDAALGDEPEGDDGDGETSPAA